jgi:hypothetical protein
MGDEAVRVKLSNHDGTVVYFLQVRRGNRACMIDPNSSPSAEGRAQRTRPRHLKIKRHTPKPAITEPRKP